MDCERFAQVKILLAHDEAGRTPKLDDHLAGCASCAADVEEMRDIVRRYRQASSGAMPEALRNRLLAIRPTAVRPPAIHRWVPLAAAALLLAVLAAPLLRRDSTAKPPPPVTSQTVDLSFTFESCEIVSASMPEEETRLIIYEAEIDRDLRELSERIVILED